MDWKLFYDEIVIESFFVVVVGIKAIRKKVLNKIFSFHNLFKSTVNKRSRSAHSFIVPQLSNFIFKRKQKQKFSINFLWTFPFKLFWIYVTLHIHELLLYSLYSSVASSIVFRKTSILWIETFESVKKIFKVWI